MFFFETPCVNNAGDPYADSFYAHNTHDDERALIEAFCYHFLKSPSSSALWGYCGSGSTEAILMGLWTARKRFPTGTPIIYASDQCHFCVPKIADILGVPFVSVQSTETGAMDLRDLHQKRKSQKAAIVVLTLGTTIRNAYDPPVDLDENTHIHLDAAFGGVITDLSKYTFDTFNVSFHKFWGCPYPCALYLTRKSYLRTLQGVGCFGKEMVCLPSKDYTLSCSRNGTAVRLVKDLICDPAFLEKHQTIVAACFENKKYLLARLHEAGVRCRSSGEEGLSVELFDVCHSFDPKQFGLSVRNHQNGYDTHVFITAHVTKDLLDAFVHKLVTDTACSTKVLSHTPSL